MRTNRPTALLLLLLFSYLIPLHADPPGRTPAGNPPTRADLMAIEEDVAVVETALTAKASTAALTSGLLGKADANDVFGAMNDDNWQPWTISKINAWTEGASKPMVWAREGDSLSIGLYPGPKMGIRGYIGQAFTVTSGLINRTDGNTGAIDTNLWFTGVIDKPQVGSVGEFRFGAPAAFDVAGNKAVVIYRTRSGGGSFDVQFMQNNSGTWGNTGVNGWTNNGVAGGAYPYTINTNAAAGVGVAVFDLSASNAPSYRMRVNNVVTAEVYIIAGGIYYDNGPGVIVVEDLFCRGGMDPVECVPGAPGRVPVADFNTVVNALAGGPDLLMNCWADGAARWGVGNEFDQLLQAFRDASTFTVGSGAITNYDPIISVATTAAIQPGMLVTGTGIQSGTRVASVNSGTSLTLSQRPTATNTGLTLTFKRDPDWVMVSGTPAYDAYASVGNGLNSWVTSTAYTAGQRVHVLDTTPVGDLNDVNDVFVCTSDHTSGSITKPGVGASWNTVWQIDPYDPTVLANSGALVAAANAAALEWCVRNKHTYWNGSSIFRDYKSARERGLMRDFVHPSANGDVLRWQRMYAQLAIGQFYLGASDKPLPVNAGPGGWYQSSHGSPLTNPLESSRGVIIRGSVNAAPDLQIADSGSSNNNRMNNGNNMSLKVDSGEGYIRQSGALIGVLGLSSQQGIHPGSDGQMLGGRTGSRWRPMFSGVSVGYRAVTSTATFGANDYVLNATSGTFTASLPHPLARSTSAGATINTSAGVEGRLFVMKNTGAGTITVSVPPFTQTSGVTNGTTTITYGNNGNVPEVGSLVTSSAGDIPGSTYVVTANQFGATLSQAASGSNSGQTFTFQVLIDGATSSTVNAGSAKTYQSTGTAFISW